MSPLPAVLFLLQGKEVMDGDVNTELTTLVAINMFARVPYQVSTALSDSGPEMLGTVEKCAHRPVKSGKSDRSGWRKTAFAVARGVPNFIAKSR